MSDDQNFPRLGVAPRLSLALCFWHRRFCRLTPLYTITAKGVLRHHKGRHGGGRCPGGGMAPSEVTDSYRAPSEVR